MKDYIKLSSDDKKIIVNKYSYLMENCSTQECENCPFFHGNYKNLPEKVFHGKGMTCGRIFNLIAREAK